MKKQNPLKIYLKHVYILMSYTLGTFYIFKYFYMYSIYTERETILEKKSAKQNDDCFWVVEFLSVFVYIFYSKHQ